MILDTERQRTILLEIIKACQLPGAAIDEMYNLKQAIVSAVLPLPSAMTANQFPEPPIDVR